MPENSAPNAMRVFHMTNQISCNEQGRRREMVNRTRGLLYSLARLLGDYQAVRRGKLGRRTGRRMAGKATGRALRRLFR